MITSRRRLLLSAAFYGGTLLLAGWPYPGSAIAFSKIYSPMLDRGLSLYEFGRGGRARVSALPEVSRRPDDNVDADALLVLSVDGFQGALPFGLSLRRDVYLPWLTLAALLVAAPISTTVRVAGPLIAGLIVWASNVAACALLSMWTFATRLRGVYTLSPAASRGTDFLYGALLAPPGNRFIGPLLLGLLIVFLDRRARPDR